MEQIDVPQTRHLQASGLATVWEQAHEHLEHSGQVGVIDRLGAHERMMFLNPAADDAKVLCDAVFDVPDKLVLDEGAEHPFGLRT